MTRTLTLALALTALACTGPDDEPVDETGTQDTDTDTDTDTGTDTDDPFVFATDDASAYTRVDRFGMPAINTAVITSKDDYNQADPADDANGDFVPEIIANLTALHEALDDDLVGLGLTPCTVIGDGSGSCVTQAAPLVVPDTLAIDGSTAAGFPNGRTLSDPVIDVTLAVVLLDLSVHPVDLLASLPLNPPENDLSFDTTFPYLAVPH